MARRISLREFQEYLSRRLSGVAHGEGASSLLGVQAGTSRWLLDLSDSGEIVPLLPLTAVPLTTPAFAGLANIRGNLHAVTDFSIFLGEEPTMHTPSARMLLVGTRYGNNAALMVPRLLGLRNVADFEPGPPPAGAPAWNAATLTDHGGQEWYRLDLKALLSDPGFVNIVA